MTRECCEVAGNMQLLPHAGKEISAEGQVLNFIFFFALCCLGKIPGGAPFSQLHKSGNGGHEDRP